MSCGAYYFLTIVDNFSRAVCVYLLLEKCEMEHIVKIFVLWLNASLRNVCRWFEVMEPNLCV